jgi:hypothetical protein
MMQELPEDAWRTPARELEILVAKELKVDQEVFHGDISDLNLDTALSGEAERQLESLRDKAAWINWCQEVKSQFEQDEFLDESCVKLNLGELFRNPFEMTDDDLRSLYQDMKRRSRESRGAFDAMEPYREVLRKRIEHVAMRRGIEL